MVIVNNWYYDTASRGLMCDDLHELREVGAGAVVPSASGTPRVAIKRMAKPSLPKGPVSSTVLVRAPAWAILGAKPGSDTVTGYWDEAWTCW